MPDAASPTLRPAHASDLEMLVVIDARCFPAGIAYSRREIEALLCAPDVSTVVAQHGQEIIGFASLRVRPAGGSSTSSEGELVTIEVLPEHRRGYLGERLYHAVEESFFARSGSRIELHVAVSNTAAICFYQRLGYRKVAGVPNYYPDAVDAWKMEKIWL